MLRWQGDNKYLLRCFPHNLNCLLRDSVCLAAGCWLARGSGTGQSLLSVFVWSRDSTVTSAAAEDSGMQPTQETRYSDTVIHSYSNMRTAGLWPRSPAAAVLAPLAPMSRLTRHHNTDRRQSGSVTPMVVCTPAPCLRHGTGSDRVWVDIFRSFVQLVINTDTELWNNWHRQPAAWHNLLSLKWMEGLSIENEF